MKIKQVTVVTAIVLIALFSGALVLYLERGAAYAELNKLNLIPQPERLTELYFENASALPKRTVAGQPISFTFVIHNMEGVTMIYPYVVYIMNQTILANSAVTVADNASTTIAVSNVFPKLNEQAEIVVDLSSLNQSIDFLLPNNN